jgi:hypothetical protein
MFDLEKANENINSLMDWIDEQRAMALLYPVFDPDVDLDEEE